MISDILTNVVHIVETTREFAHKPENFVSNHEWKLTFFITIAGWFGFVAWFFCWWLFVGLGFLGGVGVWYFLR